jgi:hypothetical protein
VPGDHEPEPLAGVLGAGAVGVLLGQPHVCDDDDDDDEDEDDDDDDDNDEDEEDDGDDDRDPLTSMRCLAIMSQSLLRVSSARGRLPGPG